MTYKEAYNTAVRKARETGHDYGLERNAFGFTVFMLPRPENRYGHELRCEVVRASDPLTVAE